MNNDNDIIKDFNENLGNINSVQPEPYRAIQNQNFMNQNIDNQSVNNIDYTNNNFSNANVQNFINQDSQVNVVPEVNSSANTSIVNSFMYDNPEKNNNFNNNLNTASQGNISNNIDYSVNVNPQQLYDTSGYISDSDKPIVSSTKKATVKINPELKTVFLLALILLVAMLFIPTLFDLWESLKIKIFG